MSRKQKALESLLIWSKRAVSYLDAPRTSASGIVNSQIVAEHISQALKDYEKAGKP